jgi:hypothetical protein
MAIKRAKNPTYYFIDVDLKSRCLIGWGTEGKDTVEVHLTRGYHRGSSLRDNTTSWKGSSDSIDPPDQRHPRFSLLKQVAVFLGGQMPP